MRHNIEVGFKVNIDDLKPAIAEAQRIVDSVQAKREIRLDATGGFTQSGGMSAPAAQQLYASATPITPTPPDPAGVAQMFQTVSGVTGWYDKDHGAVPEGQVRQQIAKRIADSGYAPPEVADQLVGQMNDTALQRSVDVLHAPSSIREIDTPHGTRYQDVSNHSRFISGPAAEERWASEDAEKGRRFYGSVVAGAEVSQYVRAASGVADAYGWRSPQGMRSTASPWEAATSVMHAFPEAGTDPDALMRAAEGAYPSYQIQQVRGMMYGANMQSYGSGQMQFGGQEIAVGRASVGAFYSGAGGYADYARYQQQMGGPVAPQDMWSQMMYQNWSSARQASQGKGPDFEDFIQQETAPYRRGMRPAKDLTDDEMRDEIRNIAESSAYAPDDMKAGFRARVAELQEARRPGRERARAGRTIEEMSLGELEEQLTQKRAMAEHLASGISDIAEDADYASQRMFNRFDAGQSGDLATYAALGGRGRVDETGGGKQGARLQMLFGASMLAHTIAGIGKQGLAVQGEAAATGMFDPVKGNEAAFSAGGALVGGIAGAILAPATMGMSALFGAAIGGSTLSQLTSGLSTYMYSKELADATSLRALAGVGMQGPMSAGDATDTLARMQTAFNAGTTKGGLANGMDAFMQSDVGLAAVGQTASTIWESRALRSGKRDSTLDKSISRAQTMLSEYGPQLTGELVGSSTEAIGMDDNVLDMFTKWGAGKTSRYMSSEMDMWSTDEVDSATEAMYENYGPIVKGQRRSRIAASRARGAQAGLATATMRGGTTASVGGRVKKTIGGIEAQRSALGSVLQSMRNIPGWQDSEQYAQLAAEFEGLEGAKAEVESQYGRMALGEASGELTLTMANIAVTKSKDVISGLSMAESSRIGEAEAGALRSGQKRLRGLLSDPRFAFDYATRLGIKSEIKKMATQEYEAGFYGPRRGVQIAGAQFGAATAEAETAMWEATTYGSSGDIVSAYGKGITAGTGYIADMTEAAKGLQGVERLAAQQQITSTGLTNKKYQLNQRLAPIERMLLENQTLLAKAGYGYAEALTRGTAEGVIENSSRVISTYEDLKRGINKELDAGNLPVAYREELQQKISSIDQAIMSTEEESTTSRFKKADLAGYSMTKMRLSEGMRRLDVLPFSPGNRMAMSAAMIQTNTSQMGVIARREQTLDARGMLSPERRFQMESEIEGLQTENMSMLANLSTGMEDRLPALSAGGVAGFHRFNAQSLGAMYLDITGHPGRQWGSTGGRQSRQQDEWFGQFDVRPTSPTGRTEALNQGRDADVATDTRRIRDAIEKIAYGGSTMEGFLTRPGSSTSPGSMGTEVTVRMR